MQLQLVGFIIYFIIVSIIALIAYLQSTKRTSSNYSNVILGNRSINYILTAFSAHASDMSDWLFMAFPAALYSEGLISTWIAIGLIGGMSASWIFVAPQLRNATEHYNSLTLSSFFEHRFNDTSGILRLLSAISSLIFFAVYIAAGLKGFGFLAESVFNLSYITGLIIAIICMISYIFFGGYHTLAWIDCFQALFLLAIIFYVPYHALYAIGGFSSIVTACAQKGISLSLIPCTFIDTINVLFISFSWAIGYFGTPHILTKFMGIKNVSEIKKARYIGLSWQVAVLFAAGLTGLIGIAYFQETLPNKELVFIEIVKSLFSPLCTGFILSTVAGATLSVITAQALVLVSVITEDLYHKSIRPHATTKELLLLYKLSILIIAALSFYVSLNKSNSIQQLVHYAWMGFGCSFGPLVILSIYSSYINKYGAYAAIITGTIIAALWHNIGQSFILSHYALNIPALIPGFFLSICNAYFITFMTKK